MSITIVGEKFDGGVKGPLFMPWKGERYGLSKY